MVGMFDRVIGKVVCWNRNWRWGSLPCLCNAVCRCTRIQEMFICIRNQNCLIWACHWGVLQIRSYWDVPPRCCVCDQTTEIRLSQRGSFRHWTGQRKGQVKTTEIAQATSRNGCQDSSVGIGTCYGQDGLGFKPRRGRDFSHYPRSAPWSDQPPVEWEQPTAGTWRWPHTAI
jgi:hypothetical protein